MLAAMTSSPSSSTTDHLLLVGGGPRSVIQVNSEIIFMLLYRKHFEQLTKLGASYNIITSMIEKRSSVGGGGAYSAHQTGMMNTGVEDDISFPIELPGESGNDELLELLSYRHRYDASIGKRLYSYYKEVRSKNLPGAVMFKRSVGPMSSTSDGALEHEHAYLMRGTVGDEEYSMFEVIRKLAEVMLPFYNLTVLPSRIVDSISVQKDGTTIAIVQSVETKKQEIIPANLIRLNTGTVNRNPITDKDIRNLTFCQVMNVDHFRKYCSDRLMLDEEGLLPPGTKILSGGMGLSGLDQISVLDGVMDLFEEEESVPLGYKVSAEAKQKYQGAITLTSRTPGKGCFPRHSFTPEWQQGSPVLGSTKQLHSLFLHGHGEEVFGIWKDIMTAVVARAMRVTPDEASCIFPATEDMLRFQFEETKWFLECRRKAGTEEKNGSEAGKDHFLQEATRTTYGAWRQATLCLIFGFGIEEDLQSATEEMESYAPLTWKGRQVWLFHRAQVKSITEPKFAATQSNLSYYNNYKHLMMHVTSSPVEIHSMFHLLVDAGIAKHVPAPYSEIRCNATADRLELRGDSYDAFLVSPIFERQEDGAVRSLTGQVQPYDNDHPSFGKVGKFRRYQSRGGELVSVEENGLSGKGFNIEAADGKQSRAGCFAIDVNNRASGVSVGSSFTLRRMAMSHLKAAGVENAGKTLESIYERSKPHEDAYKAEVMKFRKHFEDVFEIWAYVKAINLVAGSHSERFGVLFDAGLTRSARKEQVRKMKESGQEVCKLAVELYNTTVRKTPDFSPPSRDEYLDRFVDTTEDEDRYMYTESMNLAREHLEEHIETG